MKILSHPTMGAWIEILEIDLGTWINNGSHPTMGAWIEMVEAITNIDIDSVAPHDGCVD